MDYELRLSKNVSSSKSNISLDINLISWDKRGGGMTMSRGFDVTLVAWDRFGGGLRHGRGFNITKTEAQTVVKKQARLYNAYVTYKTPEVEKFYQGGD